MQVTMKALVTGPGFEFEESRRFEHVSDEAVARFKASQKRVLSYITKEKGSGNDGDLTATLDASFGGVAEPTVTVSGMTRHELSKFERFFYRDVVGEWVDFGEQHGKKKQKP